MAKPFAELLADLESAKRVLLTTSARADHEVLCPPGEDFEGDELEVDIAPLLGLDPAPHRIIRLANLSAVGMFRLSEANEKLWRKLKAEGWAQALCYDVSMLSIMHRSPDHQESGKSLFDLYGTIADKPRLRSLYLYILERVARAWPDLVRPELRLELYYNDLRYDALMRGEETEAPTPEQYQKGAEGLSVLPSEEMSPNGSAGS